GRRASGRRRRAAATRRRVVASARVAAIGRRKRRESATGRTCAGEKRFWPCTSMVSFELRHPLVVPDPCSGSPLSRGRQDVEKGAGSAECLLLLLFLLFFFLERLALGIEALDLGGVAQLGDLFLRDALGQLLAALILHIVEIGRRSGTPVG